MQPTHPFNLRQAASPLLISVPHAGTVLPTAVQDSLNRTGLAQDDTDHQVDRLYEWAPSIDVSLLVATHSRYVIDLNRPPDDAPLYRTAGTGLVPLENFAGEPIYRPGREPDAAQREDRLRDYWQPYHQVLRQELQRLKALHGHAVLLDGHSIASRVPRLFKGRLPALNLGSNGGVSAAPELLDRAVQLLRESAYSHVVDGRFKGGYITRRHGQPDSGIHALQLEIAQDSYLDESRAAWDGGKAGELQSFLRRFVRRLRDWEPVHA